MPIFKIIGGGLRALFGKQRAEQELDEELRCYMETAVEQKMRAGTGREEAARETRIEMGGMEASGLRLPADDPAVAESRDEDQQEAGAATVARGRVAEPA